MRELYLSTEELDYEIHIRGGKVTQLATKVEKQEALKELFKKVQDLKESPFKAEDDIKYCFTLADTVEEKLKEENVSEQELNWTVAKLDHAMRRATNIRDPEQTHTENVTAVLELIESLRQLAKTMKQSMEEKSAQEPPAQDKPVQK